MKFGLESPTFSIVNEKFLELYRKVDHIPHIQLKLQLWRRHLEIVYGKAPDENEFIKHTYLVTLVKLITYLRLHKEVEWEQLEGILNGSFFRQRGINNFIEDDFFSWILEEIIKIEVINIVKGLLMQLVIYNYGLADEDLFKEIYQEIIGPTARHRIGEYYTPEWLAQLTLENSLKQINIEEFPSILDPACGSGTFLTNSIHYFKNQSKNNESDILQEIISKIVGIDINPLAVVISKANYIISLGELIKVKKEPITIPIFLADSIKLPKLSRTLFGKINAYQIPIDETNNRYLLIPETLVADETKLSEIFAKINELLIAYKLKEIESQNVKDIFKSSFKGIIGDDSIKVLFHTINELIRLINANKDTIWLFILRNFYAPIRIKKEKFDLIIGNPPWIAFRYIDNKTYQEFIKEMIFKYKLLTSKDITLFTQMEIATLFIRRCADLFLKKGGLISFVMPRSVLTAAKHHEKFKDFDNPKLKLLEILDMNRNINFKVEPLFNVPSCVLLLQKDGLTKYPIETIGYSGQLPKKNLRLKEAHQYLDKVNYVYEPPKYEQKKSYYYKLFKAGAAIYPRPLWFIEFIVDPTLGINPDKPKVRTSEGVISKAKGNWNKAELQGNVEKKFIHVTILSRKMRPFGKGEFSPIIVPVEETSKKLSLLNIRILKMKGYLGMANWLSNAQKHWDLYASKKDKKNFPNVEDSINYLNLLETQNINKRYIVLSAASGSYTMATIVDRDEIPSFEVNGNEISPGHFMADKKTYLFETNSKEEAVFLVSIINSTHTDNLIKKYQTIGLFGERDIGRAIFELPIPKYNFKDKNHKKVVELGFKCMEEVINIKIKTRKGVKEKLTSLKEIDEIVETILKLKESNSIDIIQNSVLMDS